MQTAQQLTEGDPEAITLHLQAGHRGNRAGLTTGA
jgi:hypothetical protein